MRNRDILAPIIGAPCLTLVFLAACSSAGSKPAPSRGSAGAANGTGNAARTPIAPAAQSDAATDALAEGGDAAPEMIGEAVARQQLRPNWITLDGANMYWLNDGAGQGAIVKKPIKGGTPTVLVAGLVQPDSLRTDGSSAYWIAFGEQAGIHKVSLAGGAAADLVISAAPVPIRQIALDADFVYWTDGPGGSVLRVSKSGGTPSSFSAALHGPSSIAIDASGVYVVESGEAGAIVRIPSGGGAAERLAEGQAEPHSLVLTAQDVFWVNGGAFDTMTQKQLNAAVMRMPKSGGAPVVVVSADSASALAVDGASVYYAAGDSLMRAPAGGGGAASVFASGQTSPRSIAADATFVYWTNAGTVPKEYLDGDVRRLAK